MTVAFGPERWANEITVLLNAAFGADRFPIDIPTIAKEYSRQRFPDDPIVKVLGDDLPTFDGALYPARAGRKGWGIIYNNAIASKGRINFTLAHEFGHYLLHRVAYPQGFECGQQKIVRWDSTYGQVEHQANVFAANFLMPLDDFRRQIPARTAADLEMLQACAERYKVSLIAATLRWLSYTEKRAILVVSRDGFILWSRSSEPALHSGAYFKTSAGPIEIPATAQSERLGGDVTPMHRIVPFAMFSTRRLSEIIRITWEDFDQEGKRVLVRDMKHPGEKAGNDQLVDVPDEAIGFAGGVELGVDTPSGRIFPYSEDAVGAAFTRAMKLLAIDLACCLMHDRAGLKLADELIRVVWLLPAPYRTKAISDRDAIDAPKPVHEPSPRSG